ncbi:hypothetical protein NMY22_g8082 [Coprinellus aureogranulatus]|nr:hypothetical protein NMY22_g8082 [Coprinellus aureogranulatus]
MIFDASQTPKRSRGPVVDEHNNLIMVDGVPLVLSERDSGSTYSQEDRSATMSTYAISDMESHQSDQHNPSPQRGRDTDTLFRHTSYPAAVQDDDDTLLIDIAEDKEIETVHSKSQSEDFKHHDCDCTCSRHFTSCQLVQRLRMPCAQDWAGALRIQYGIDGYKSVKQLAHVPASILLKQFSDLIRFVEGGKLAHATILAYAIGRVKGRDIFITDEVVGLIVDDIWGSEDDTRTLSSLALVAKCFTPACQERLWRIVIFRSGASLEDSTPSLKQAKALRFFPHLGSYVQTLEFHVDRLEAQMSQGFIEELDCFAGALKMLGSIVDLRFAWREEILRIATNDCLRRLTLDKISGFPLEALRDALQCVESLSLRKFSYDGMRSTARSPAEERSVAKVKTLKCDSDSYRIFNSFVDPPLDSHFAQVACNFAVLEDLELWVNTFVGDHKIVQQATRLRVLRLEGALKPPSSDALQAILKQINPSAFNTLTILALSLDHVSVENVILDPLMGACSDGFPAVKALRSFDLYIHLDSHSGRLSWRRAIHTLNAETRPSAWTELDNSLSVIEDLKEVKIRILIEYREYGWLAVMRETAEKLHRHVLDTVYPAQLRKLCSKKEKGELEFEFAVESIAMEKHWFPSDAMTLGVTPEVRIRREEWAVDERVAAILLGKGGSAMDHARRYHTPNPQQGVTNEYN